MLSRATPLVSGRRLPAQQRAPAPIQYPVLRGVKNMFFISFAECRNKIRGMHVPHPISSERVGSRHRTVPAWLNSPCILVNSPGFSHRSVDAIAAERYFSANSASVLH